MHNESNMLSIAYQWIDLIWLPVALLLTRKGQRIMASLFVVMCILTLRTQLELMGSINKADGLLGWLPLGLYERGLIIYGFLIALFLILAHFSPNTKGVIFLAAALSLYVCGFCVSMVAMVF